MRRKSQYSLKNPWWLFPSNTSLHYFIYYVIRSYWIIKIPIPHEIQIYILVISFVYFSYHFTNVRTKLYMYFLHFLPLLKVNTLTSKHLSATQWTQTSLRRFQDFWKSFMTKPDVATAPGRRCRIYDVLKTSDLGSLEEVWFYDVLKTSDLRRLEDVCKTMSV